MTVREQANRAQLGDISVAYTRSGSGRPLVLVHGLGEDGSSWSPQLGAFSGYETFAYDLRGLGETTIGDADGTLTQLAGDLAAFLREITGPAVCVGFSLGGTIVLRAAAETPDLITRVVAIGTSSKVGRAAVAYYEERIAMIRDRDRVRLASLWREDIVAGLVSDTADVDALVAAREAAVGSGEGFVNAARAMARLHDEPLTPLLGEIACHVDIVAGERDAFCPRRAADIMLDALLDGSYYELPGLAHLMNVEDSDAVTGLLSRLLNEEESA